MPRGKKLPDQAVATMIRSTATKPDVRKNKILDGLKRNNQVFFLPWLVSPLFFPSVSFSLPQTLKRTVRHTDLKRHNLQLNLTVVILKMVHMLVLVMLMLVALALMMAIDLILVILMVMVFVIIVLVFLELLEIFFFRFLLAGITRYPPRLVVGEVLH